MKLILYVMLFFFLLSSCSKDKNQLAGQQNTSAFTVVNLINGSNGIITNFSPQGPKESTDTFRYYASAAQISFGSFQEFSSYTGSQPLTITSATDTLTSEWTGNLSLPEDSIMTLYFGGADTLHLDTMMTSDHLPYYPPGDSVIGVRFINFASGASPVNVDIQGASGPALSTSLPYKASTFFFQLPVTSTNPVSGQYVFEFRDQTGNLLTTYNYSGFYYFKNVTVILGGIWGNGGSKLSTMMVNNF